MLTLFKNQWFQIFATFSLGVIIGAWQLQPNSNLSSGFGIINTSFNSKINEHVYKQTAEIEPLLKLQAPDINASVDEWYRFAVSLDDLEFGSRYNNSDDATPVLTWYTLIAKYKPQALYKLYNQGKLNTFKFKHLLSFGYLKYWDEYVQDVDRVLLENTQAVLTMAHNKGVELTRKRVKKAFFKIANIDQEIKDKVSIDIENLLFAMKSMSSNEKAQVKPMLLSGAFKTDPRYLYRLQLSEPFKDGSEIITLLNSFSKSEKFTNLERPYSENKVLSSYMTDSILLGSDQFLQTMIEDIEFNSNQPTDEYCASCGLALTTDGLMAYPLINASQQSKIKISKDSDDTFILTRKDIK